MNSIHYESGVERKGNKLNDDDNKNNQQTSDINTTRRP
jgi:hypothetical protein